MTEKLPKLYGTGRAWAQIDLEALSFNAASLRSKLHEGCELMAIIKADAYGHGARRVAERLYADGVKSFAVAAIAEAVKLREEGFEGEILVLNYTHPDYARSLS